MARTQWLLTTIVVLVVTSQRPVTKSVPSSVLRRVPDVRTAVWPGGRSCLPREECLPSVSVPQTFIGTPRSVSQTGLDSHQLKRIHRVSKSLSPCLLLANEKAAECVKA